MATKTESAAPTIEPKSNIDSFTTKIANFGKTADGVSAIKRACAASRDVLEILETLGIDTKNAEDVHAAVRLLARKANARGETAQAKRSYALKSAAFATR